ncbi:MAG: hypothetical protein CUN52_10160 [Phototrophicales bacterium]|nr:MAG: hypothetical protein CUN52_10160 [Phototrophicales bacterium]
MVESDNVKTQPSYHRWLLMRLLMWWITPRATERDARFREQVIRVSTMVLLTVVILVLVFLLPTFGGSDQTQLNRLVTMITFIILLFIPAVLVHNGRLNMAAWALLMMPTFAFVTLATTTGLWLSITFFFLFLVDLYGQIVLPRNQVWLLLVLTFGLVLFIQLFPEPVTQFINPPAAILNDLVKLPTATLLTIITLVIFSVLLYVLRREFDSRQDELSKFVDELESRVQERTKELEIARQQAEDANKIKSQFLANMSHELRTPLNAILNFTAFVADGVMGEVNAEQEEALRQSISSGKHLLSLINDILDVTKIEAGLMDLFIQSVDLNEILNGVVGIGKGLSKDKPIELIVDIQDHLPHTYGDKRRLRQVFLNIVSNAFKFTPQGSVTIHAHATDTHLHVYVKDTGIGIAPQHQSLVFESFKQAQNDTLDTVGTGLGMPISKYFVESHNGRMWFETEVGKGTTFFVELPILTEEQANQLDALSQKA